MSKATIDKLRDEATARDNSDTLRKFRERFYIPQNRIYLDGNSLGLMSRDAENATLQLLDQWRELAVEGWTEAQPDWFTLPERISELLAPLMGASPESVIVTGSTTVNLHQLLATLYQPGERSVILTDDLAFPSDVYAIESHLRLRGIQPSTNLRKVPACDGRTLTTQDIVAALDEPGIQMVILPSVIYTSGQLLDMATITASARKKNILIGWDCSHSIGAVPHELDAIGADFAFWCHYKYLNAGPGSVGGLYLNPRHFDKTPGLAGWWSSDKTKQFDMAHTLVPAYGAGALQIGTPNLLSLAPLIGSLQIHREAGMQSIREKSLALTSYLCRAASELLSVYGIGFATPKPDADRGGHLALTHPMASALSRSLRLVGVVPDYRPPDILRLAPIALYTSFGECMEAILRLQEILAAGEFPGSERELVP